jgi:hypothetical protein
VKRLLDPDMSDFIKPDGEILRKARHRGIVAFDNQTSFPKDFSDDLASLVTGAGDSKRELYTTDTEYAFQVQRPVIVNGINMPSDRADLLSRFVALEVPIIEDEDRVSESRFWEEFEVSRGKLLGAFFDILSGVLRHRAPLGWAPRLSDWGELASALYEHLGWGRDLFKLDYEVVEGKQHDDALEGLVAEYVLKYLYAEFDDGKDVLIKSPHDLWEGVMALVPIASRRWFPQSAATFGKELVRLKQPLAYKGFDADRGTVGTGNDKKRVIKIARIDAPGTAWDSSGTAEIASPVPGESPVDKPKSAPLEEPGTAGTANPTFFSGIKKKNRRRSNKRRGKSPVPAVPEGQTSAESGVDKPKTAGTSDSESPVPQLSQETGLPSRGNGPTTPDGLITTDEGVQEAIRKLKGNK